MKKSAKSKDGRKAARGQLWLHLPGMVREALYDTVIGAGLACVDEVLETERVALCSGRGRAVWRVASLGYRAGGNGAHAIRWSSAPWSRWCWECRPEATRA